MLGRVKRPIPLHYSQAEPRELRHRVDKILVIVAAIIMAMFLLVLIL